MSTLALLSLSLPLVLGTIGCDKKSEGERPAGLPAPAQPATPPAAPPAAATPPPAAATPPPAAAHDDETVPAAPDPKATITGTITLPAAHKKAVAKTDTIFIVARRAGGPPGPASMMAVQKHPVGDFPMPFTLSARDAMIPGTPFDGAVNISVRLDKDGDALTRRKGDLLGMANDVKVGTQDVAIPLDTILKEDQTLGGPGGMPGMMGGGMPPGHGQLPPNHP